MGSPPGVLEGETLSLGGVACIHILPTSRLVVGSPVLAFRAGLALFSLGIHGFVPSRTLLDHPELGGNGLEPDAVP